MWYQFLDNKKHYIMHEILSKDSPTIFALNFAVENFEL